MKIYPLNTSDEKNTYRIMMKFINYTVYKINFELECVENCSFADGRKVFKTSFVFTKNNINLNSLSADVETIQDPSSPIVYVDFDVKPDDIKAQFSMKQTKIVETSQNKPKMEDVLHFDFGKLEDFFAYLESNKN